MPTKGVKNNLHEEPNRDPIKDPIGSPTSPKQALILTPEQSQEIMDKFKSIVNDRLDKLYDTRGADGEMYAYGIAVNQVKKKIEAGEEASTEEPPAEETPTEEPMDKEQKLKEMIQAALSKPLSEKKKSFPDLTGDGKVTQADILKARGVELEEDLDLGHQDDEPHMIKGELYKIAQNALALYKMLEPFDNSNQEVDLPAWWQSKITKACTMLGSAKSYLEFELKEPQIDAMIDIASQEDMIDEKLKPSMGAGEYVKDFEKSKAPQFKGKSEKKKQQMAVAAYLSAKDKKKVAEAVMQKLKAKKP